tara:strand:- start:529 stop:1485 length:957 start_codon:yes stop_codon:yes gene_type:complete
MSNIVPFDPSQLPAEIAGLFEASDDLSSGVSAGFGIVSIRGSKWRIKHGGEENPVVDANGDPVATLPAVLISASPNLSRIFYKKSFEDGDKEEPDCYSLNGETPEPGCKDIQNANCATCPHQVWGSKITPAGKKAKACADNRRTAIVPLDDMMNEMHGGPMLLRVPAASLADLSLYGKQLKAKGRSYRAVGTRLGFDLEASYPKLTFRGIRALTQEELMIVAHHLKGDVVSSIIDSAPEIVATPAPVAAPAPAPAPVATDMADFEDEAPAPVAAKTKPKPAAKKKAEAAAPAATAPSDAESSVDSDLEDILSDLDGLA